MRQQHDRPLPAPPSSRSAVIDLQFRNGEIHRNERAYDEKGKPRWHFGGHGFPSDWDIVRWQLSK